MTTKNKKLMEDNTSIDEIVDELTQDNFQHIDEIEVKDKKLELSVLDIRVLFNKETKLNKLDNFNKQNPLYIYNDTKNDYIVLDSFDRTVLETNIDYSVINKLFFINKTKKLELGIDIDLFVEDNKIKVLLTNISKIRIQLNANTIVGQLEIFK